MEMTTLTSLPYFHGTIDTRECREMLPDLGDFLIRNPTNEMVKSGGSRTFACILTTAVTPDQASDNSKMLPKDYSLRLECTTRLKSYGIILENGVYSLLGAPETYQSVEELCNSYTSSRKAFPQGGMALRPVARRPWQLLLSDIEFPVPEVVLGSGEFGKVIKGKLLRHGIPPIDVALKCATAENHAEIISEMFTEARAMRALMHPNIIRLEGVVVEKLPLYLVIEFLEGSSLLDALRKKKVNNIYRFPICMAVLYAVLWMHMQNYIHRDIAARNVMISHDCRTVKLIDFGLAKHGLQFTLDVATKIPLKRLAPEVQKTKIFSAKSDTWALAICFWEIYHDGAPIYSNVIPSLDSKPPAAPSPAPSATPTTPDTSKNSNVKGKQATQTRKRAKKGIAVPAPKPVVEAPKPASKDKGEPPELVITQNVDFLPEKFVPRFKMMTEKKARKRIELAEIANVVEKEILPTLPEMVRTELKYHVDRRPPFDPNFKVQFVNNNSVVTQPTGAGTLPANPLTPQATPAAVTPTFTPSGTTPAKLKTTTRRRSKSTAKNSKSDLAQSSTSAPEKKTVPEKQKTSRRRGK
ncbi:unnamed protein product [Caenorhabditis nigoni]